MLIVHRLSAGGHRYYIDAVGEAPGAWWGAGATTLGLSGDVAGDDLRRVLPAGPGRVPAFDLTFAAPKSVSVLHGLGSPAVEAAVRSAHDTAVRAGLAYMERHACVVREAGVRQDAPGFVVATFRHRVSRADDPHLHTHAVVANLGQAADGRWLALHTPLLYAERRAGAAEYHAVLRHELSRSLGVTWEQPVAGRADVMQVPDAVRAAFSQRREHVRAAAGDDVARLRWASRVTRPEREGPVDIEQLSSQWRARAAALGWEPPPMTPRQPAGRCEYSGSLRDPEYSQARPAPARAPATRTGLDELPTGDRWTRADLMVAIGNRLWEGGPAGEIEAACDRIIGDRSVIAIGAAGTGRHAAQQFTTSAALDRQSRVTAELTDAPRIDGRPEELDRERRRLGEERHRIMIVAADQQTAGVLAARTGALASDLAAAPTSLDGLGAGDQLVLVGAAGLDSVGVSAVLEAARRRSISVSVATAPGPFALLLHSPGAVATVAARGGDLTVAGSAGVAASAAVTDWSDARGQGREAVLVAPAAEVAAVNGLARDLLRARGMLGEQEVSGFAVGDVVRFAADRPTLKIRRHDSAVVVGVDELGQRVQFRVGDGSEFLLRATQTASVVHAHAVPAVPALVAGRGDMFVVGGSAPRHVEAAVHRYVTVPVEPRGPHPEWYRHATTDELQRAMAVRREEARLPTSLTGLAGERRRLDDRLRAAKQWVEEAEVRHGEARDTGTRSAWRAQLAAGRTELRGLALAETELAGREREGAGRMADTAPARAALESLAAQVRLRDAALTTAMELDAGRALGRPGVERDFTRSL